MKVLHVVRRLDAALGGAPAAAANVASALQSQGHEVTIATTVDRESGRSEIAQLAATLEPGAVVECFVRSGLPFDHSRELGRWLRDSITSFDLVEVHGVFDYPCQRTADLAQRHERPFLVHAHGSLDPFDLLKHRTAKRILGPTVIRRMLDRASAIMVTSEREGAVVERYGAQTPVAAIALPYRTNPCAGNAERFRRKYQIPDGPILLFLGRVDYKKGLGHVVNAADLVRRDGASLTTVLAGNCSSGYASALRLDVIARQLDSIVLFPGHLDEADKADALAAATAFALVSDNENYGLVLVEAARAGLPILISDQVYLEAELSEAGAALVVSRDGRSIAHTLLSLLSDPERLHRMSEGALRAANDLFDWDLLARAQSTFRSSVAPDVNRVI